MHLPFIVLSPVSAGATDIRSGLPLFFFTKQSKAAVN
jgi:hypothetical protein